MRCLKPDCPGELDEVACPECGSKWSLSTDLQDSLPKISHQMSALEDNPESAKDEILNASASLESIIPDNYESWKAQAGVFLAALQQLETRQLVQDSSIKLMGVPLLEGTLRDAAETALRHCAHFSPTLDERISLIDKANSVRRTTWF